MDIPRALQEYLERDEDICLPNGAELLDEDEFEDVNGQLEEFDWELPKIPAVAVDGGLGYFLYDEANKLVGGAGAVWWVERSCLSRGSAFVAAKSFEAFVKMPMEEVNERWAPT